MLVSKTCLVDDWADRLGFDRCIVGDLSGVHRILLKPSLRFEFGSVRHFHALLVAIL